jgi:hypothetical protein
VLFLTAFLKNAVSREKEMEIVQSDRLKGAGKKMIYEMSKG